MGPVGGLDERALVGIILWWGAAWVAAGPPALIMSVAAVLLAHFAARGRIDLAEVARDAMFVAVFAAAFREIVFSAVRRWRR